MDQHNEDDTIPMQYLSNENPYAFCADYHKNSINLPEKKTRLNALQKIQPQKLQFKMPQKVLEREKQVLLETSINSKKSMLLNKAMHILGIEFRENFEIVLEANLDNDEILDIALELKKLNLILNQKRLRSKVAAAIAMKFAEDSEVTIDSSSTLEIDNLKDALIFCKLEDLYSKKE